MFTRKIFHMFSITALVLTAASWTVTASADAEASAKLSSIIAARSDEQKARDVFRNPQQTLEFFGIEPGMKVGEVLPGGGWYTQILAPYVGEEGAIYGINYAHTMFPLFGMSEERIQAMIERTAKFEGMVAGFPGAESVTAGGYAFGQVPEELNGTLDAVLIIRGLHNLHRFEEKAGSLTNALAEVNALLKDGGVVGVVQHKSPEDAEDSWAQGQNGYLKQTNVITFMEKAGFELVAESDMNANPKDVPGPKDYVWRLPPSLNTADENKEAMKAIGESNRMTLKFVKK